MHKFNIVLILTKGEEGIKKETATLWPKLTPTKNINALFIAWHKCSTQAFHYHNVVFINFQSSLCPQQCTFWISDEKDYCKQLLKYSAFGEGSLEL